MASNHNYIATPTRTAAIMKAHDIKMKKSLGQNFLVEPNILTKMIDAGEITKSTTVLEIGPGIGALTEFLAIHSKEVLAFEIDHRFVEILAETLAPYDNVTVIEGDILQVDFQDSSFARLMEAEDLVVVANLPYYITTPIIMHLLGSQLPFQRLIMMMQKEVAERMTAQVGTKAYGSLSVAIQNQMESEIAFIVPKTVFIPKPNVDSAVLKLVRREEPLVQIEDQEHFEAFVQATFTQRRKTLWNNLRHYYPIESEEALAHALETSQINPQRRAESLDLYEFHQLYQVLTNQ